MRIAPLIISCLKRQDVVLHVAYMCTHAHTCVHNLAALRPFSAATHTHTHNSLTVEYIHLQMIHSRVILQADLCTPIQVDPVPHQCTPNTVPTNLM